MEKPILVVNYSDSFTNSEITNLEVKLSDLGKDYYVILLKNNSVENVSFQILSESPTPPIDISRIIREEPKVEQPNYACATISQVFKNLFYLHPNKSEHFSLINFTEPYFKGGNIGDLVTINKPNTTMAKVIFVGIGFIIINGEFSCQKDDMLMFLPVKKSDNGK